MATKSDIFFLHSLSSGQKDAWERLFDRYYEKVKQFVEKVINDSAAAPDVAQNIFMRLWKARQDMKNVKSLDDYMFIAARNGAFDYLRRHSKEVPVEDLESIPGLGYAVMRQNYDAEQIRSSIESGVASMPAQRQLVWRLSREQHLSNQEIADKVGISKRTVDRHLYLALRDLRSAIGDIVS